MFTKAGNHNVTDTIQVTVTNVAPIINAIDIPMNFGGGGDYNDGSKPVNIPSQPMQMNTQVTFGRIS